MVELESPLDLQAVLNEEEPRWKSVARKIVPLPQRIILVLMMFIGLTIAYAMRICLSLTILSIVVRNGNTTINDECRIPRGWDKGSAAKFDPIYKWDEQLVRIVLSSFYLGYVLSQVPCGILADIIGGRPVLLGCVALSSIFTVITPIAISEGGPYALIAVRILLGLIQGAMYPAMSVLFVAWIPLTERTFYGALVYSSAQVGTLLGTLLSGEIVYHFQSWNLVFYIFGGSGIIWCVLFWLMCTSHPFDHPYISKQEKVMLFKQVGYIKRGPLTLQTVQEVPFTVMLRNRPLIVLITAQIGHCFGYFVIINDVPKYMSIVLHFNILTLGHLCALTVSVMCLVALLTGKLCDWIILNNMMSLTNCRKIFSAIASFFPAFFMIFASYAGCRRWLFVICMSFAMAAMGFYYSGMRVNALDLTVRYAGTVMGFVNSIGAIMGFVGPYLVDSLISNVTVADFRIVFWLAFILYNGTIVSFIFFASGELQNFDNISDRKRKPRNFEREI